MPVLLDIVFEDDDFIAINKPHGLLVHRSPIDKYATEFALQMVRDQIGQRVYLTHRLDRKTSGVLIFAKNPESNSKLSSLFEKREVTKEYLAIVRGFILDEGEIDYAITNEEKTQEALTHYKCLQRFEINVPCGKHSTSRYSLVELSPKTGRFHQLRKHMAHIFHPIIGDRPHGCNKQNRLWKHEFGMDNMMLHASTLNFEIEGFSYSIESPLSPEFLKAQEFLRRNVY